VGGVLLYLSADARSDRCLLLTWHTSGMFVALGAVSPIGRGPLESDGHFLGVDLRAVRSHLDRGGRRRPKGPLRDSAPNHQDSQCMEQISYSTQGFIDREIAPALEAIAAAGFSQAEISSQSPHACSPLTGNELDRFRSHLSASGVSAGTVHAPMRENVLGAPDEVWRREKMPVMADYLRFTGAIGAAGLVIHPVPNPMFVTDPERAELSALMCDATRRSLDELVPVAQDAGVRMLLENLPYNCGYPFLNVRELRPLIDPYPQDAVGLVVDTGHAWTSGDDPAEEIRLAGSRLWGTHLQDVDGENPQDNHWVPGHGGLNWPSIRAALDDVGYRGARTFEVIVPRYGESLEELSRLTREAASSWGWDA
jgi:sugar phosphate isomerase/epimerase